MKRRTRPIQKKEETSKNGDRKIDHAVEADFESPEKGKNPDRAEDTYENRDEDKKYRPEEIDEQDSDGSANAFEGK